MDEALAAFGFFMDGPAEAQEEVFALWPENAASFEFWCKLRTQWQVDFAGNRCLNYCAVEAVMNMTGIARQKRKQLFEEIRTMEISELNAVSEQR